VKFKSESPSDWIKMNGTYRSKESDNSHSVRSKTSPEEEHGQGA
jgi:hypothetical protein